jgi:uncharacterized protein (TIGR02453 family)
VSPAARFITPELFAFFRDLERNNDREWFAANKQRYHDVVRDPLCAFIEAIGSGLRKISPRAIADPSAVGGSLFRIYRDTRFAKDKRPYKTNAAMVFRLADKRTPAPAYYLQLDKSGAFVGAGVWHPEAQALRDIREAIVANGPRWKRVAKLGLNDEGARLKRAPRGFEADHPLIEDIKRKSFATSTTFGTKDACAAGFHSAFLRECKRARPLVDFLGEAVGLPG